MPGCTVVSGRLREWLAMFYTLGIIAVFAFA
jgi:hypothetical protein